MDDNPERTSLGVDQRGLGSKAVRGAVSTVSGQAIRMLLQIGSVIILARLLTPQDYGLVAMVLAVIGVGEILRDCGLSPAAIQAEHLSRKMQSNLFWVNSAIGFVLTIICAASAPLIAYFYGRSALVFITLAFAPTFLLSGLGTQYRADLTRRMKFKTLAITDVGSAALALLIGIVTAAMGAGYWALVMQQVSAGVISLVITGYAAGWWPTRYDKDENVMPFIRFGISVLSTQVITYATANIDSVLIGRLYGAVSAGLYNRGVQLVRMPLRQASAPFATVALPVLARVRNDRPRLLRTLESAQIAVGYPVLLVVGVVVATSKQSVTLALGSQWVGAAPIVAFIAIGEAVSVVGTVSYWAFLTLDITDELLRYTIYSSIVRAAMLVVGSFFGVVWVAAAYAASQVLFLPFTFWRIQVASGLRTRGLLFNAARIFAVASIGSLAAALVVRATPLSQIETILLALLTQLAVTMVLIFIPPVRRDLQQMSGLMRMLRSKTGT
ncbi:lipopolysaccharide biosynthesis protein [Dermatophilaceae bacterium Sec6.4]